MARILITGVSGFVGKHLVRELKSRQHSVLGVGREAIAHEEIANLLDDYSRADLTNSSDVASLPLEDISAVINLAGLAKVSASFNDSKRYNAVNVGVLECLCERLAKQNLNPRVIAVSTAYVYEPSQPLPISEQSRTIKEGSPYALSKLKMEKVAKKFINQGMDIVIVRPFNHIGPGQETGFLIPDLYAKIKVSKGTISVGDLTNKRDYTDVRDVVRAYSDLALARQLKYDLYDIASGRSISGENILDLMLSKMHLAGKVKPVVNPEFLRPNDFKDLYGSYSRLKDEVGWGPRIEIEQTISDFVNWAESQVASS